MDWRGIEWSIPVFALLILATPVCGFAVFRCRVRRDGLSRSRAFLYFSLTAFAPLALYVLLLLVLVGVEELTGTALVTEGLARGTVPLVAAGLLVWLVAELVFALALFMGGRVHDRR